MVQLTLMLDNLRSAHNVGAILRTADAMGVIRVICCGSTPYPRQFDDLRDPVIINRNTRAIAKTALGAETTLKIEYYDDSLVAISALRKNGWTIYGLEQTAGSTDLAAMRPHFPAALVVGNEVSGLAADVLAACDTVIEIKQHGVKESLNVSVAAGIALYTLMMK